MKNINKILFGIIALWAMLATIFGFYDLEISKNAIMYKDSLLFEFGNKYGDDFDDPLLYVGITILLGSIFNDIKMQRKIGIVMIFYSMIYLEYKFLTAFNESRTIRPYLITIFLIIYLILAYNQNWRNYVPIATSMILLFFFQHVIVDIIKLEWGRVRFEDLSSDSEFTEWYVINGPDPNNSSFPSSHTASAFMFLPLLILINNKNMSNKFKIVLIFTVIGFGVYVGVSRVIDGKHYASDVLFSAGICSILTIGFYKIFNELNFMASTNKIDPTKNLTEIIYSDFLNQWLRCYYNQKGGKFWKWFNSYEEAIDYSPT